MICSNWVECNGQTIDDSTSPHGAALPSLNTDQYFLRGHISSRATEGSLTHQHVLSNVPTNTNSFSATACQDNPTLDMAGNGHTHELTGNTEPEATPPSYFQVVWIIRIK